MNLKWVLCSALIFGIFYAAAADDSNSSSSSASEEDNDKVFRECSIQYLRSKGMIEGDSGKNSHLCSFVMSFARRMIRETIKDQMKREFPDKASCIMAEYDKNVTLFDNIIKAAFISDNNELTDAEKLTQSTAIENQLGEQLITTAILCEVDVEKFAEVFGDALGSSEETTTTSETAAAPTTTSETVAAPTTT